MKILRPVFFRHKIVTLLVLFVALTGFSIPPAKASFTLDINETAFTKLLAETGVLSGTGRKRITSRVPCVPDFWNMCQVTLFNANYQWSVLNPRVDITQSGIQFRGRLSFTYAGITVYQNLVAPVALNLNNTALVLSVNSLSLPIRLNLPGVGRIRITTINVNPNLSFQAPVRPFPVTVDNGERSTGHLVNMNVRYFSNFIRVTGIPIFN